MKMSTTITRGPRLAPVSVGQLRLGALYVAPSGRLCRLAPPHRGEPRSDGTTYLFEYVDVARGYSLERETFGLSRSNVDVLREVRR